MGVVSYVGEPDLFANFEKIFSDQLNATNYS